MEGEDENSVDDTDAVVQTACEEWSLNVDVDAKRRFWWNSQYSLSVWEETLKTSDDVTSLTDTDVWEKYIEFQLAHVYKLCPLCREPEGNEDMKICCYCGATVHRECSVAAALEQTLWKPANRRFQPFLCVCRECQDLEYEKKETSCGRHDSDNARRAAKRMLSLEQELPKPVFDRLKAIFEQADKENGGSPALMSEVRRITRDVFQSAESLTFLAKGKIASKGGGVGVVATADIPAFTVVGVYPGYSDDLSGEQAKIGRPVPKYALMHLNCANYFNEVFIEFSDTFTPFINEPCVDEVSNCAWIQEQDRPKDRLSIITVKPIQKGEELLIGYGPLYPRDYPHRYDAFAFHPVEGYTDPVCYSLWHWPSLEEKEASFVCYVGKAEGTGKYTYWETEAEYKEKRAGESKRCP